MEPHNSKRDILDLFLTHVNRTLLVFKLYYFFYFAAFGSLFPLISVYFKQLGLSATQCGILVGSRPFVEFVSAPFWGMIAERWKKGKVLILISLLCGLAFTVGIGFTKPIPEGCLVKGEYENMTMIMEPGDYGNRHELLVSDSKILYPKLIGQSPIRLIDKNILMKLDSESASLVIPVYSPIVYHQENISQTFVVLLVLLILGEFMSSPSLALADTAVLNYLKDDRENYSRQRMYGSVGWGLAMFCIGISLDQAIKFHHHPCGWPGEREKNYMVCFTVFSVFMCFAMITATQMTFTYDDQNENMYFKVVKDKVAQTILGGRSKNREQLLNEQDEVKHHNKDDEILERQLSIKLEKTTYQPKVEDPYEENYQINNFDFNVWIGALKTFKSVKLSSLLFLAWFMGFGVGIVFTFLFWHLQDIKGSPTLFGIASVINHVSEIIAYFFSGKFIATIGHTKVLYLGLLGNVVRFLYASWIENAWWILPFEMIQGLTHAAIWSACFSYMAQTTPKEFRNASQRILQGIHHGLGKGCGAIFGGMIIGSYGTQILFRSYGIVCCFVLIGFMTINYFLAEIPSAVQNNVDRNSTAGLKNTEPHEYYSGYDQPIDTTNYIEDETFMSPHGIPFLPNNDYGAAENYNAMKGNSSQAAFRQY